jgi:hypothetical protein
LIQHLLLLSYLSALLALLLLPPLPIPRRKMTQHEAGKFQTPDISFVKPESVVAVRWQLPSLLVLLQDLLLIGRRLDSLAWTRVILVADEMAEYLH